MKIKLHQVYILTTSIAMLMYYGLQRTTVPWWMSSAHCAFWIIIGLIKINKNRKILDNNGKSILFLFGFPYVIYWFFTILAWLKNGAIEAGMISRSISLTLQYTLIIGFVLISKALFGKDLIRHIFHAAVLNNLLVILFAIARWGIKDFITVGLIPFSDYSGSWTLDNLNITAFLEVHDITFAFGFFLIYYLVYDDTKDKKKNAILSAFFIYLGFKRIQLMAIFITIGLLIFIKGRTKKSIKFWIAVVTTGSLSVLLAFIWLIDTNALTEFASFYNVNFTGRIRVYVNLSKYFSFGPSYWGRGMASGRIIAQRLVNQNILHFTGHSDILMSYIDYGFWGFITWILFLCFKSTHYINKKYSASCARLWMLFCVYALITYLTDNTIMYFCFQLVFMVIMTHAFNKKMES